MVVGVTGEDQIDSAFRQQRVVVLREDDFHVRVTLLLRAAGDVVETAFVHIDGVDLARGTDCVCQSEGKVPATRAEIGHVVAWLYGQ